MTFTLAFVTIQGWRCLLEKWTHIFSSQSLVNWLAHYTLHPFSNNRWCLFTVYVWLRYTFVYVLLYSRAIHRIWLSSIALLFDNWHADIAWVITCVKCKSCPIVHSVFFWFFITYILRNPIYVWLSKQNTILCPKISPIHI